MSECVVLSAGVDVSDADAAIGDVKSTKTFYSVEEPKKTGTMPTKAIVAANDLYEEGYHAGNVGGLDAIDVQLAPANIKSGINIFGKVGTYTGPTLSPIFERYWTASMTADQIYTPAVGGIWGGTGHYQIYVYYYSWDTAQPADHGGIHVGQSGYFRIRNQSGGTATGLLYRAVMQNTNPLFDHVWDGTLVEDATYTPSLRGFYNIAGNSYASIRNYTGSAWLVVQDDQEGYLKNAICSGSGSMRVTQEFYDRWNVLTRTY